MSYPDLFPERVQRHIIYEDELEDVEEQQVGEIGTEGDTRIHGPVIVGPVGEFISAQYNFDVCGKMTYEGQEIALFTQQAVFVSDAIQLQVCWKLAAMLTESNETLYIIDSIPISTASHPLENKAYCLQTAQAKTSPIQELPQPNMHLGGVAAAMLSLCQTSSKAATLYLVPTSRPPKQLPGLPFSIVQDSQDEFSLIAVSEIIKSMHLQWTSIKQKLKWFTSVRQAALFKARAKVSGMYV